MKINFKADQELSWKLNDWAYKLRERMMYSGIYFEDEDVFAVREGQYILVVANPIVSQVTILNNQVTEVPRRNLVKVVRDSPPNTHMVTDSGRFLVDRNEVVVNVELLPIFRSDLIVLLDDEGNLIQDGVTQNILVPILVESEVKRIQALLGDMIANN